MTMTKYSEQTIFPPPPVLFECSLKAELILLHSFDAFDIDCRCAALLLQYGYEMMGILGLCDIRASDICPTVCQTDITSLTFHIFANEAKVKCPS